MKKIGVLFLLACFLVLGIMIGTPSKNTASSQIQQEIGEFEEIITEPGNKYDPENYDKVDPNLSNNIAKRGENLIEGVFDVLMDLVRSLINEK
jgi:predicted PurR-regulated permease PerM